jgi:nucleoside-diphosphate-sugar epimerase
LVSGATGFIGSHIAAKLCDSGDEVRALVRRESSTQLLTRNGVECREADLADPDGSAALDAALEGIDVVYHNAAVVTDWGRWEDFEQVSVGGTKRLIEAAIRQGVSRIVHMSSASVYGFLRIRGKLVDESFGVAPRPWRWDYYGRAKAASEKIVLDQHEAGAISASVLRPTIVCGERDRSIFPRLSALLRRHRLPIIGSGENEVHVVYAGDVADAALAAGRRAAAAGRIYNLDGPGGCSQRRFFDTISALAGVPRANRRLSVPSAFLRGLASEVRGHISGREDVPDLTRYLVALSAGQAEFDTTRARTELGWAPSTTVQEALERTHKAEALAPASRMAMHGRGAPHA